MAISLRLPRVFGAFKDTPIGELDMPTTQVRAAQPGYDPLASVSIMEQLRSATTELRTPKRLPVIGHLPIVRQFQLLGVLILTFLVFAAVMLYFDGRITTQGTTIESTATEMQMLSQRLARSSVLAGQGQPGALDAVRESRDRFQEDLNAFLNGGTVRGATLGAAQEPALVRRMHDAGHEVAVHGWDHLLQA